jgi:hypothetical protein
MTSDGDVRPVLRNTVSANGSVPLHRSKASEG